MTPRFIAAQRNPHPAFTTDKKQNEGWYTLQFFNLFQLMRDAIHTGNGGLLLTLYKPCLPIFDQFHRTKCR